MESSKGFFRGSNIPGHLSNIIWWRSFCLGGKFSHGWPRHENSYGLEGCLLVLERYGICGKVAILHGESVKGRVYILYIWYHMMCLLNMMIHMNWDKDFFQPLNKLTHHWRLLKWRSKTMSLVRKVKNSYRHLLKQDQVVPDEARFFFWLPICSIETITLPETNQSALEKMAGFNREGNDRLPKIQFQGDFVNSCFWFP